MSSSSSSSSSSALSSASSPDDTQFASATQELSNTDEATSSVASSAIHGSHGHSHGPHRCRFNPNATHVHGKCPEIQRQRRMTTVVALSILAAAVAIAYKIGQMTAACPPCSGSGWFS